MTSTAIPVWKKRFVILWYAFIRSEEAHEIIKPIITRPDDSPLTNEEMTKTILDTAESYGLPFECWDAAVRYYSEPRYPDTKQLLDEIVSLIEPITIDSTDDGINIHVSKHSTQSELEAFIRIKYSKWVKPSGNRLRVKSRVTNIQIVNQRLVHMLTYKEIEDNLLENGIDMEEPNIRSVVAAYRKRMKKDSSKPMR